MLLLSCRQWPASCIACLSHCVIIQPRVSGNEDSQNNAQSQPASLALAKCESQNLLKQCLKRTKFTVGERKMVPYRLPPQQLIAPWFIERMSSQPGSSLEDVRFSGLTLNA